MQQTFYAMLRHRRAGTGHPQKACRAGLQYMITYTQLTHIGAALKGSDQQQLI